MNAEERAVLEEQLRRLAAGGDHRRTATLAVRAYGPEILGFLVAIHRDEEEASEVFAQFCEELWRSLPGFQMRASFRTWLYVLARHASHRHSQRARRRQKERRLSECPEIEEIAERVRTATLSFLRTAARDRLSEVRRALPVDDQELLILRVDKELEWSELACVFHEGSGELAGAELLRGAARMRKRYQLLKDRLREQLRG
jgi:RNA polymerase sigma-70 factor (ECF subfamily)